MKTSLIVAAAAAVFASPAVFAQAAKFDGLSVMGSLDITDSKLTSSNQSSTKSDGNLAAQVDYSFPIGRRLVLGFGGTANLTDPKVADGAKMKKVLGAYVASGFAPNNTLWYAKLAAVSGTADISSLGTVDLTGVGVGFGVRHLLRKGFFIQVEYMSNIFDQKTWQSPVAGTRATDEQLGALSLGLGYKF